MSAPSPEFELFSHGADIGVRGRGPTVEAAYRAAADALASVVTDPARIEPQQKLRVERTAPDAELRLVELLNAIIFEMSTRRMLLRATRVTIEGDRVAADLVGEAVDVARHEPAVEPKGATLTGLRVARENGGWVAECVIDV